MPEKNTALSLKSEPSRPAWNIKSVRRVADISDRSINDRTAAPLDSKIKI
ncbi:hypothetical protein [Flavobacterium aquidurense]|nr:hypothetical protein [Flavobacterium aquidurense]MDR7372982.1 hypothetical protein [Flavobacterium aquidurense]